ncbi:MAG: transglycosylase SLT domain-containing protein [Chitinivibrionales bacterium]|nr:transglycosylase SLT domain-containing protein [Chitinivibrionales bacterium]
MQHFSSRIVSYGLVALLYAALWLVLFGLMKFDAPKQSPIPHNSDADASHIDSLRTDSVIAGKSSDDASDTSGSGRRISPQEDAGIFQLAYQADHFDPDKWLQSDHAFFKRSNRHRLSEHDKIVRKFARRYGFDWRLISAQIYVESNFRDSAQSGAGAVGLMQIMPSTARFMGTDPDLLLQPEVNIGVGCMYDQRMYSLWGRQTDDPENRLAFALASYNAGRGRVLKSYSSNDGITSWDRVYPSLPLETQMYVHKIYLKHNFYKQYFMP